MDISMLSTASGSELRLRSPSITASRSPKELLRLTNTPSLSGGRRCLRPAPRVLFVPRSTAKEASFTAAKEKESRGVAPIRPVYRPTPPGRDLRTPHSGYHFDRSARQFFEGWYFRVSIPEIKQSFCFIYSVENPAFKKKLTLFEEIQYGRRFTGSGVQVLGAFDKYICQHSPESHTFWGSRHELSLGNTFTAGNSMQPPDKEVPPEDFNKRVAEGFQVTPLWNQGFIRDDGRSDYVETVKTVRWEYSTKPVHGWGNVGSKQKSTAGWLAAFPVFEPHWQVCMAGGLSTGWIEWDGERFEFENAPSYSEKNWGGAFPKKWFWVQCNVFEGASGEVSLTAAGGLRELPGGIYENAALIGVHHAGIFFEFVPWNGVIEWEIDVWGRWHMSASNESYMVELEATTEDPGVTLRAPLVEAGLVPACKDAFSGILRLRLWEKRSDGSKGKVGLYKVDISQGLSSASLEPGVSSATTSLSFGTRLTLDVSSDMAAVEVGGGPWFSSWKGKTATPEILSRALNLPIDVDSAFGLTPFLKPPGL